MWSTGANFTVGAGAGQAIPYNTTGWLNSVGSQVITVLTQKVFCSHYRFNAQAQSMAKLVNKFVSNLKGFANTVSFLPISSCKRGTRNMLNFNYTLPSANAGSGGLVSQDNTAISQTIVFPSFYVGANPVPANCRLDQSVVETGLQCSTAFQNGILPSAPSTRVISYALPQMSYDFNVPGTATVSIFNGLFSTIDPTARNQQYETAMITSAVENDGPLQSITQDEVGKNHLHSKKEETIETADDGEAHQCIMLALNTVGNLLGSQMVGVGIRHLSAFCDTLDGTPNKYCKKFADVADSANKYLGGRF